MKRKISLSLTSIFLAMIILEFALRFLNIPNESNKAFQRKDLEWTEKNVVLNSAGYRDKDYSEERSEAVFRIYAAGDSYTYGWLVDNPQDTYPKIIEEKLNSQGLKTEVINAGSPGFSIDEDVGRFISEGKYYSPDLVVVGINDDEANYSKTYVQPSDNRFNKFIRSLNLYQITLGNFFRYKAEKQNHDYSLKVYTDKDSEEWKKFSKKIVELKNEAGKINSGLVIILFPHIHPNRPNDKYDYYPFNEKLKQFGEENGIIIIDPLENFLKYREKSELVINPLDPHPTPEMNRLVADSFLKQFDNQKYLQNHSPYIPLLKTATVSHVNESIGPFQLIKNVKSDIPNNPWVYFETKNGANTQNFTLKDKASRKTNIYIDNLQTAKSFTHAGIPGATIEYHLYPEEKGIIKIPKTIYGYQVIGINHIFALNIDNEGNIASTYLSPLKILQNENEFIINYNPDEDYHNYRISLSVAVKQIDINTDGRIENMIQTEVLKGQMAEESQTVVLPVTGKISSWQLFSEEPGKSKAIAFVDGVMTKVSEVNISEAHITLSFPYKLYNGKMVEFAVAREYKDKEEITIEFD